MSEIHASVHGAYVSSVVEGLDEAFKKMDEARIWARRQAFLLGGGVLAAVTASDSETYLGFVLWVVVALCITAVIALELGKYTQADSDAANLYNDAMDMVQFVETEEESISE
jgi:hypothetical protein